MSSQTAAVQWLAVAIFVAGGACMALAQSGAPAPASAPAEGWTRPTPLSQAGATDSPGGTHPLIMEGNTVHAVWTKDGVVYYRGSQDAGAIWGHTLPLTTGGTALYPCSLEVSGPVMHLVWPDTRNDGKWEPYYKRSDDGGKTWGADVRLSPGTHLFRLGTAADGNSVHLAWASNALEEKVQAGKGPYTWTWGEIYYKRSSDGGRTWEKNIRLSEPNLSACRPAVAASGPYVHVAWLDRRDAAQKPGWDWEIYYKRSTDGGATWGPDVRMSHTPEHSRHPQMLATEGGRVCCVWEDGTKWQPGTDNWSGDGCLMASVSLDSGATWHPARRITSINTPNGRATHAKSFASGSTIHLSWMDAEEGAATAPIDATAVYYMSSPDGGLTWTKPQRLMGGLSGEPAGVAGNGNNAIELLNINGVIHYMLRPSSTGILPVSTTGVSPVNASSSVASSSSESPVRFQVANRPIAKIDRRLFGQFMERPSWGETGAEAAVVPGTHELQPGVLKLLEEMKIAIVRFPGGTDVDYMDWRDMVDGVPGRDPNRPVSTGHLGHKVTNRFGYDEFLRLATKLGWETILVVNLRDAQLGLRPLNEAAQHAAGLVAYCNAPVGAKLPAGMPDWPSLRAQNGHPKPYGVKYFQIGNETWAWEPNMRAAQGDRYEQAYLDSIAAYEEAIHAVDPAAKLITDYNGPLAAKLAQRLGSKIAYFCGHWYTPGAARQIERDGKPVPIEGLSPQEAWNAWVSVPRIDAEGLSVLEANVTKVAPELGYKVAFTEWNWNGWWGRGPDGNERKNVPFDPVLARGVGAAGFLHALMRLGDTVEIGTQSMLVGKSWNIASILVDESGVRPAHMNPCGAVTALYSRHHGDKLMEMKASGVPTYVQPLRIEGARPAPKVAMIDALATADANAAYWHAINRSFDRALEVTIDFSALGPLADGARLYVLESPMDEHPTPATAPVAGRPTVVRQDKVAVKDGAVKLTLPARSVCVLEVGRKD